MRNFCFILILLFVGPAYSGENERSIDLGYASLKLPLHVFFKLWPDGSWHIEEVSSKSMAMAPKIIVPDKGFPLKVSNGVLSADAAYYKNFINDETNKESMRWESFMFQFTDVYLHDPNTLIRFN